MRPSDVKPWFREDITYILAGIVMAHRISGASSPEFDLGFLSSIVSVAVSFGIDLSNVFTLEEMDRVSSMMERRTGP